MTINIIKKSFVYSRFEAVTGAFGLARKNWLLKPIVLSYLQSKSGLMLRQFLSITYSINLHRVINHQIPIESSTRHSSSQPPAVSSLQAYQTPAR
jgi:hypothetical protein